MIKQKSVLQNIKNVGFIAKKLVRKCQTAEKWIFTRFFGHNSDIFQNFEKRIFAWSPVILGASFDVEHDYIWKIDFWPLLVTFEVTALTSYGVCWAFLMLFGFSINYSTYLAAETNHTFKKNLSISTYLKVLKNQQNHFYLPK